MCVTYGKKTNSIDFQRRGSYTPILKVKVMGKYFGAQGYYALRCPRVP